jgi:serine/threonine protein kinase
VLHIVSDNKKLIHSLRLCGFSPFQVETPDELIESIKYAKFSFDLPEWEGISEEARIFIQYLLVVDPKKRFTAEVALRDEWLGVISLKL